MFACIGGDFNHDNMSPSTTITMPAHSQIRSTDECDFFADDSDLFSHSLYRKYEDICSARPGLDKDWAVGTELRLMRVPISYC